VIGDNSRADIEDRLSAFLKGADVWQARPALDDDTAPRARDFIAGLKKLGKEAEEHRKAQKEPHMLAAKAVDDTWKPIQNAITRAAESIEQKLTAYLREKKRQEDAARAEAARQQAEAEAQARAAAEDAARAATEGARIEAARRVEEAEAQARTMAQAAKAEPTRVESATGLARRAGLKTVRFARIVSIAQLFAHYRNRPELAELLERLANADIRAAKGAPITIPGVEIDERQELAA
jgi:hypothetical protein